MNYSYLTKTYKTLLLKKAFGGGVDMSAYLWGNNGENRRYFFISFMLDPCVGSVPSCPWIFL